MSKTYTAFAENRILVSGAIEDVVLRVLEWTRTEEHGYTQTFDDETGQPIDFDLSGRPEDVLRSLTYHPMLRGEEPNSPPERRGPGRPKLGVTSREISLLPRHWQWLREQSRPASATLRMLVEERMKAGKEQDTARKTVESTYRVMLALAGDFQGFEEAARALFAHQFARFATTIDAWPKDIKTYLVDRVRDLSTNAV